MNVVSDASPLITLSRIDHLHLLPVLYGTVHIPPEVFDEVAQSGVGRWGSIEVANAAWIQVTPVDATRPVATESGLGIGETYAILLARQLGSTAVLMDDHKGRAAALQAGVTPIGSAGVLYRAYLEGNVTDLRRTFQLLLGAGAYIDPRILDALLRSLNLPPLAE